MQGGIMNAVIRSSILMLAIAGSLAAAACAHGPRAGGPVKTAADTPVPAPPPAPSPTSAGVPGEVQIQWAKDAFVVERVQGFHIFRGDSINGPWTRVTDELIDVDSDKDGVYEFVDRTVEMGREYYYRIQIVSRVGETQFYRDPFPIIVNRPRGLTPEHQD
ncbi:MAG: hypothetical protein Kow0059_01300 [Candidatus Sumerlaeia bacterium]